MEKLKAMHEQGTPLEEIYSWEDNWEALRRQHHCQVNESVEFRVRNIRSVLAKRGWSDDKIWEMHIELCDNKVTSFTKRIKELERKKEKNVLLLEATKKCACFPSKDKLDLLLRYLSTHRRQFYKALNELERLQRLRGGDNVPPPIKLDVDVEGPSVGDK